MIECQQCGTPTTRRMYCGNACKIRAHRQANPDKARTYRKTEQGKRSQVRSCGCGRILLPYRRVCDDCRSKTRTRTIEAVRLRHIEARRSAVRMCGCGVRLSYRQHICADCAIANALVWKRADKAKRKALQRGKVKGAERFDPLEILSRDGWRCHICGVSTPKRLRGTYDDRAPEIDHIIPLALGGQHTRLNCACACRRCNIRKGSQAFGQLRLVA